MRPRDTPVMLGMALLSLGVHLAVNAFAGYGYFRDELYYIACSKHLALGYVDQPPLSIGVLALARALVGDSVFAIRLVPAIASSLSVFVLSLLVRRLGGRRSAMILAALCFMASPLLLGTHTYYSMNSFDVLFWLLAAHAMLGVRENPTLGAWLGLGAILGLGLLNKTSVLWLAAGVGMAILLTEMRRQLRHAGPYLSGQNGLPHLEFLHNATTQKYSSLTRARFLADQFFAMNPVSFLVVLPGLWWCLLDREGRRPIAFQTGLASKMVLTGEQTEARARPLRCRPEGSSAIAPCATPTQMSSRWEDHSDVAHRWHRSP